MISVTPSNASPGTTGSWQSVDVTTHGVPTGAAGVWLRVYNSDVASSYQWGIRRGDSTDNRIDYGYKDTQVDVYIGVDPADDTIDIQIANASIVTQIMGYFESGEAVFFANSTLYQNATATTWQDIDITAQVVGGDTAYGAIFEVQGNSGAAYGLRKNGSTDNRPDILYQHCWAMIGVDGSDICESYSGSITVNKFHNVGYIKSTEWTFNTNATSRTVTADGAYHDLPAETGEEFALYEIVSSSGINAVNIRKKGATYDYYRDCAEHIFQLTELNASGIAEAKFESANNSPIFTIATFKAAGGAYTLTADSGTYTEAGTAASLQHDKNVAAVAGAIAEVGTAASLEYGRVLSAGVGAYVEAGQDATLIYTPVGGYTLTADGGTYSEAGQAAGLQYGRVVSAAAGAIVEAGFDASLLATRKLSALAGAYVESGTAAGLAVGYKISALVGAYIESGTNAGLTWSGAPASTGGPDIKTAGTVIPALKSESALPVQLTVTDASGGVTGLTVKMQVRDSAGTNSYLDFNDATFKTSGWTTKDLTLTDLVNGIYAGTLDLSAITNLPSGSYLTLEYTVSGTVSGVVTDLIIFDPAVYAPQILTVGKFIGLS